MSPARNQLRHNAILKVLHTSLLFKLLQRQLTPIEPDVSSAFRNAACWHNQKPDRSQSSHLTVHELGHMKYGYTLERLWRNFKKVHQSAQLQAGASAIYGIKPQQTIHFRNVLFSVSLLSYRTLKSDNFEKLTYNANMFFQFAKKAHLKMVRLGSNFFGCFFIPKCIIKFGIEHDFTKKFQKSSTLISMCLEPFPWF